MLPECMEMPPSGWFEHFTISLATAYLASLGWFLLKRKRGEVPAAFCAGLLAVLAVGLLKEAHDLIRNPWSLSARDLLIDSAKDMLWNIAGAAMGAALAWAVLTAFSLFILRAFHHTPFRE